MVAAYHYGHITPDIHPTTKQSFQNYRKDVLVSNRNIFRGVEYVV